MADLIQYRSVFQRTKRVIILPPSLKSIIDPIEAFPSVLMSKTVNTIFSKYFLSENLSDCKIVAGDKEFPTHRFVLAETSGICEKIFSTEMAENKNKIWKIDDFDPTVVQEFLEFAYKGTSQYLTLECKDTEILMELFRMGHKYEVLPLKYQCEALLKNLINDDNVVSLYQLGFLYESETLKMATKFHYDRFKLHIISSTETLRELLNKYPDDMIYELIMK